MSTDSPTIPPETARHVLWMFGRDGGYQPGTFTQRLLEAFAAADMVNTAKLANAYPDYAAAFMAASLDPDGIAGLHRIATGGGGPLGCKCGDTAGPFDLKTGLCDDCSPEAKLLSALEDGGWLDDNARQLMAAYAALVLQRATVEVSK